MLDFITINEHSSIRIDDGKIIYSDPYNIKIAAHDADIILITHSHFDHYSPDDIRKVMKSDTVIVCPTSVNEPHELGLTVEQVTAGEKFEILGISHRVPSFLRFSAGRSAAPLRRRAGRSFQNLPRVFFTIISITYFYKKVTNCEKKLFNLPEFRRKRNRNEQIRRSRLPVPRQTAVPA